MKTLQEQANETLAQTDEGLLSALVPALVAKTFGASWENSAKTFAAAYFVEQTTGKSLTELGKDAIKKIDTVVTGHPIKSGIAMTLLAKALKLI